MNPDVDQFKLRERIYAANDVLETTSIFSDIWLFKHTYKVSVAFLVIIVRYIHTVISDVYISSIFSGNGVDSVWDTHDVAK